MQAAAAGSPMMRWLPLPRDFRKDLRAAAGGASPTECLESLATLPAYRLGFLETVQVDRALGRLGLNEAPGFSAMRLALLASSTVDHLPPAIRVAGLRRKLLIEVYNGAYGQYRQELLDPTSSLHRFAPHICRRFAIFLAQGARDRQHGDHSANVPRRERGGVRRL
jgi:hypothetical protein